MVRALRERSTRGEQQSSLPPPALPLQLPGTSPIHCLIDHKMLINKFHFAQPIIKHKLEKSYLTDAAIDTLCMCCLDSLPFVRFVFNLFCSAYIRILQRDC